MKLILGNGWEQVVEHLNGEEVVSYMKNGEEYTKEEYMNLASETISEMEYETNLRKIAQELDHRVAGLLLNTIDIDDIQTMTGHLSEDVENTDPKEFHYSYYEVSRQLRIIANYLHHVSRDLTENHKEIELLKKELFQKVVSSND